MKHRSAEKVSRPSLIESYKTHMVNHLVAVEGATREEAVAFVTQTMKERFKDPLVDIAESPSYGNTRVATYPLSHVVARCNSNIVSPSGSVYVPVYCKESILSAQVRDGLKQRKALKKKMLAAAAAGNDEDRRFYHYGQSTVKIRLNSLPGGLSSAFNIFYDKGGYNAITSAARSLIAQAYTTVESFLTGNVPFFSESELLNHIYICKEKGPSEVTIRTTMQKHNMRIVSRNDLYEFYLKTVQQYDSTTTLPIVSRVLDTLEEYQIQFLFYMNNLKHIVQLNEPEFKTIINRILDPTVTDGWEELNPADLWSLDEDLLAVLFTVMTECIGNHETSSLVKEHPNIARKCVQVGRRMQSYIDRMEDVLDTFIYHDICVANILTRKTMFRNTVLISDTDSVIYTSKDWVIWYVGHVHKIEQASYNIAALATYWLTKAVADTLIKYSIMHGATGDAAKLMKMKNEYLYPVLVLFDQKKVYAGTIKVQEGVILPKAKPDIKGAVIRGSTVPKISIDYSTNLIVDDILYAASVGNISAVGLIKKVIDREQMIIASLQSGETTYLPRQSVKPKDSYADPEACACEYVEAWNTVFGKKYELIMPPDKVPVIKLQSIDAIYLSWLMEYDKQLHANLIKYIGTDAGPTSIVIPNTVKQVPIELVKLMDMRHIVYQNLKPVYLTLERLNICVGFEKHKLLFSDVYASNALK